ncbi:MAG: endonuclease/exonuclease/phosphatase family protein [Paludibacteraceae bacterium]|nr:endonuclease/exonuclease/phosphatase family protein [Paludibacteraceae bacterium]
MKHFLLIGLLVGVCSLQAKPLRVVSYNVENLFHPKHDTVCGVEKDDMEWTPDGARHWTYTRYYRKVESIARVLTNIGEWDGVDIVGLQEVENAACLKRLCHTLRPGEYDFVHYESPDRRGIDVALIYRKARIDTISSRIYAVNIAPETTRDILYVCAQIDGRYTVHLFVCHMPSQRGGAAESTWKRVRAKQVLQGAVDSILAVQPSAAIIVMGDMNSAPQDDLFGLTNRMQGLAGTYKWHGRWACLDQFYSSPTVDSLSGARIYDAEWLQEADEKYLGMKPKRSYNGYHYQDGFSDHLPIVLEYLLRD